RRDHAIGKRRLGHATAIFAAVNRGLMFGDQERALGKIEHLALLDLRGRLRIEWRTAMAAGARFVPNHAIGIGDLPQRAALMARLAAARARRAAARRAMRAARCGKSPIPIAWFGTKRAPAAIAVRRSIRSRPRRLRSARCSILPSARSSSPNIRPRFTAAKIAGGVTKAAFPDGVVSP